MSWMLCVVNFFGFILFMHYFINMTPVDVDLLAFIPFVSFFMRFISVKSTWYSFIAISLNGYKPWIWRTFCKENKMEMLFIPCVIWNMLLPIIPSKNTRKMLSITPWFMAKTNAFLFLSMCHKSRNWPNKETRNRKHKAEKLHEVKCVRTLMCKPKKGIHR